MLNLFTCILLFIYCLCIFIQTNLNDDLKKCEGTTAELDPYSVTEGLFLA